MRNLIFSILHDLQAVIEQNPGQLRSHGSHIDPRIRIGFADDRKCPDMVHVGMADDDGIHAALFLYSPKIRNRILGCRLPDPGIQ